MWPCVGVYVRAFDRQTRFDLASHYNATLLKKTAREFLSA